jgi:cell division protein ZapA
MTMEASTQVNIKILEKEYQISCPISERVALLNSAELLNTKMREIRDSGKVIGLDRIAVMAALNMANELLRSRNVGEALEGNAKLRLQAMRERIEGTLQAGRQLDLQIVFFRVRV